MTSLIYRNFANSAFKNAAQGPSASAGGHQGKFIKDTIEII